MAVPEVKDGKQEVTTLFVENIPATLHWKGLWFAFARHGDVVNVYIARKLSRGGKRFGFVRMKERIDAVKAIERLQGFVLYGSRLTVKLANAQGGSRLTSVNLSNIDDFRREARRVRINKEDETEKVTGDQNLSEESKHKRLSGHVENEDLWGLRRCLVGETTTVCSLSYIHNRLIEWGVREIKIQRMGAKLFLLTIADEDLFLLLEDLNWSYLKEIFSKVTLWSEKMNYLERATWLEVRGIPILGWNYTNPKKIAELWGTFEFLGENANHTLDCERVTVLISTKQAKRIEEEIEMEIGGEIFVLSISELGFKDDSVLTLEKRVKKFGSLLELQNRVLSKLDRKKRDKALRRRKLSVNFLEDSELSGTSLSDSDIKKRMSSVVKECEKVNMMLVSETIKENFDPDVARKFWVDDNVELKDSPKVKTSLWMLVIVCVPDKEFLWLRQKLQLGFSFSVILSKGLKKDGATRSIFFGHVFCDNILLAGFLAVNSTSKCLQSGIVSAYHKWVQRVDDTVGSRGTR
ncbi:hypothetical protein GQ457_02G040260 [Hibiscus cannabinus]